MTTPATYYRYTVDSTGDLKPVEDGHSVGPYETLGAAQAVSPETVYALRREGRQVIILTIARRLGLRMEVIGLEDKP